MKALLLKAPNELELMDLELPKLQKGEVLVKIAHAPINPSDLSFIRGTYGLKKEMPVVPGLEGSGTVVEVGEGLFPRFLKGKRVACAASHHGTWAEYMVAKATSCLPLSKGVSLEQGSMLFVNPLTALSFINKAKAEQSDCIIMNAAGSTLAAMVYQMAQSAGISFIGLVRSDKLVEGVPISNLVNTNSDVFLDRLSARVKSFKKVLFFDAVGGGELPQKVLVKLPAGSKMIIYGRLDLTAASYDPGAFLFKDYKVEGFWLSNELKNKSLVKTLLDVRKVQAFLKTGYETKIRQKVSLEEMPEAINTYENEMTGGKFLLSF